MASFSLGRLRDRDRDRGLRGHQEARGEVEEGLKWMAKLESRTVETA